MEAKCDMCKRKRAIYSKKICKSCYTMSYYRANPKVKKRFALQHKKWKSKVNWNDYMKKYYAKNKDTIKVYQSGKQKVYWQQKKDILNWINALAYKYNLEFVSLNDFKVSDVRKLMELPESKVREAFFKWYSQIELR